MSTLTGRQAGKLIEVFADTPTEQVQEILGSGLLTDLRDGNIAEVNREEFRRILGLMLRYPDWVREHLTPELEATNLRDPGEVELWLDPRQRTGNSYLTGHEVYEDLKKAGLLERSLSFGELKFLEKNPDRIPAEFRGKWVCGWASVVRRAGGNLNVPCLNCNVGQPCVDWYWLDGRRRDYEPAGLRK